MRKALTFLRLVDKHDRVLSLTDIGLWIVLIKLALVKQPSVVDLTALAAMLLARGHKKAINARQSDKVP